MYQSNNLIICQNSITGFCLEKITLPYTFKWLITPSISHIDLSLEKELALLQLVYLTRY